MWLHGTGASHEGALRQHNDESWHFEIAGSLALGLVAHGMGHATSGRPAADVALECARTTFARRGEVLADAWWQAEHDGRLPDRERAAIADHVRMLLSTRRAATLGDLAVLGDEGLVALARGALVACNRAIHHGASSDCFRGGFGATAAIVIATPERIAIGHVGDARVYRLHDGALAQLTEDHSLRNDYKKAMPELTSEQIDEIPKGVITRALGMKADVDVDVSVHTLEPGDVLLLTTRGLWLHHDDDPEPLRAGLVRDRSAAAEPLVSAVADTTVDNVTALSLERSPVDRMATR